MASGRIKLGSVMSRARKGDTDAIKQIFAGFVGSRETIVGCGYLGALGYILPEHSFWCVADKRVCGLLIRMGGRVNFRSGFLDLVNSVSFSQPSLISLWLFLIGFGLIYLLFALAVANLLTMLFLELLWVFFDVYMSNPLPVVAVVTLLLLALGWYLSRWVVRIFYRLVKSGCTFWTRESLPVFIFADRNNLQAAQAFMKTFTDEKSQYR